MSYFLEGYVANIMHWYKNMEIVNISVILNKKNDKNKAE
jgi:hypothetical protein